MNVCWVVRCVGYGVRRQRDVAVAEQIPGGGVDLEDSSSLLSRTAVVGGDGDEVDVVSCQETELAGDGISVNVVDVVGSHGDGVAADLLPVVGGVVESVVGVLKVCSRQG